MMNGGILWVAAANLVIWTGIFLYLIRLDRRLTATEKKASRP
jgi:CcmD family protein